MGTIIINGKKVNYQGSLTVINGKYFVNGNEVTDWNELTKDQKQISIEIHGDVDKLDIECCDTVTITGNVKKVKTISGDIEIHGNVEGDVESVSGSIDCGNVGGDAKTVSGNIRRK